MRARKSATAALGGRLWVRLALCAVALVLLGVALRTARVKPGAGPSPAGDGPAGPPPPPWGWARPDLGRFSDAAVQPVTRSLFQNAVRHGFGYYFFSRGYGAYPQDGLIPCNRLESKYGSGLALLGAVALSVPGAWQPESGMDDYDGMADGESPAALTPGEVEARTRLLLRSIAACHTGNGGRRIGPDDTGRNRGGRTAWQTAQKVGVAATAGWLMDEALSLEERGAVARMVRRQLSDRLLRDVEYWSGRHGDSYAEEESGQALFLSIASVMFPEDPEAAVWRGRLLAHWLGSVARPSDPESRDIVHGAEVRDVVGGYNLTADGLMINHGKYFPQYQTTIRENLFSATHWVGAGRGVPRGALRNAALVYRAFVDVPFPAGGEDPLRITGRFLEPGGTMYRPGTWKYYAPNGIDRFGSAGYGYKDLEAFASLDAAVNKLGLDSLATVTAKTWLDLHGGELLRMQERFVDRRCFSGPYRKALRHPRDVTRSPGIFVAGDVEHAGRSRDAKCVKRIAMAYLVDAMVLPEGWEPFNDPL